MAESVYHHGISVRDLAAWRTAVAAIGFTKTEGPPRVIRNVEGDRVGQYVAWWLGEEIHTQIIENPATGQQLDFVQIAPQSLRPRRSASPLDGDTTVGIPCEDPQAALDAFRAAGAALAMEPPSASPDSGIEFAVEGVRLVLTPSGGPFTRVHYNAANWPRARQFYVDVLGFTLRPLAASGAERFAIGDCGGRVEIEVSPATVAAGDGDGKMYPGGNHFRLMDPRWPELEARLAESGLGSWLWKPNHGFAQVFGPSGESIELYSTEVAGRAGPA